MRIFGLMRNNLSFLLVFFLTYSTYGNNNLDDFKFDIDSLRFITSNDKYLTIIFDKSVYYLNENFKEVKKIPKLDGGFDKTLNYLNFEILKDSIGKTYFVRKNLGEVFEFRNNNFYRLDKSSHIKTSTGSFKLYHKGHILSFFGRDQYQATNFILDFNHYSKEWNKVIPSKESDIPAPRTNSFYKKINNNVHYFGGRFFSEKNIREAQVNDYYIFNLNDKTHRKYGTLVSKEFRISSGGSVIDIDSHRSLFIAHQKVSLIDFKNLNYENLLVYSIFGVNKQQLYSNSVVKIKNKIYYLVDQNLTGLVSIQSTDLSKIIELYKKPSPLLLNKEIDYQYDSKLNLILLFLFGLIIIIYTGFRLFKLKSFKKQNILKQSNYLTYDKNIVPLDFEESCVMDFLIENLKVKLSDIFELECFQEYSETYRKVYVPKLLVSLEDKFKILGQKKSKILSLEKTKNKYDKRIIEFQLKGNVVIYKGWLDYILRFNLYYRIKKSI